MQCTCMHALYISLHACTDGGSRTRGISFVCMYVYVYTCLMHKERTPPIHQVPSTACIWIWGWQSHVIATSFVSFKNASPPSQLKLLCIWVMHWDGLDLVYVDLCIFVYLFLTHVKNCSSVKLRRDLNFKERKTKNSILILKNSFS